MTSEPLVCPRCEGEYLPSARECSECGIALVPASRLAAAAAAEAMPPAAELVCVRAASVGWARALSEELSAAGISHRIEAAADDGDEEGSARQPGVNLPYGLYVREADLEAALAIDARFMQSQIPDMPVEAEPVDDESCPACGDPVSASDEECPGCGLALLAE